MLFRQRKIIFLSISSVFYCTIQKNRVVKCFTEKIISVNGKDHSGTNSKASFAIAKPQSGILSTGENTGYKNEHGVLLFRAQVFI